MSNQKQTDISNDKGPELGIPGCPSLINTLSAGGMYALAADNPQLRDILVVQSLEENLHAGRHCLVATAQPAILFLTRCQALGISLERFLANDRVQLFSMADEYGHIEALETAGSLLDRLRASRLPSGSLIITHDIQQRLFEEIVSHVSNLLEGYRNWFVESGHSGLFVLNDLPAQEEFSETGSYGPLEYFSGAAEVGVADERPALRCLFWRSDEGAVANESFPLVFDDGSRLRMTTNRAVSGLSGSPEIYYCGRGYLDWVSLHAGHWHAVDSLEALREHDIQDSALLIIAVSIGMSLSDVATTLHYLRQKHGAQLRIVIREVDFRLRYYDELILLHTGVNMIIHRTVIAERLPLLISSLKDVHLNRQSADPAATLASLNPSEVSGYLPPTEFMREINSAIHRASESSVPFVVAHADFKAGVDRLEWLEQIETQRPGDIVTVDAESAYIFFYACHPRHADLTLRRLIGQAPETSLEALRYLSRQRDIQELLDLLRMRLQENLTPDYSTALAPPAIQILAESEDESVEPENSAPTQTEPATDRPPAVLPEVIAAPKPAMQTLSKSSAEPEVTALRPPGVMSAMIKTRNGNAPERVQIEEEPAIPSDQAPAIERPEDTPKDFEETASIVISSDDDTTTGSSADWAAALKKIAKS